MQAPDEEAVDGDQLARTLRLDVPLRLGLAGRLVCGAIARNERQPAESGGEAVPAQAMPNAVVRDAQARSTSRPCRSTFTWR